MPFNKTTAAAGGRKGGKWTKPPETVRNKQFIIKLSQIELDAFTQKAAAAGISRTELIIRAVTAYDPQQ
jgi:hypothetical protein